MYARSLCPRHLIRQLDVKAILVFYLRKKKIKKLRWPYISAKNSILNKRKSKRRKNSNKMDRLTVTLAAEMHANKVNATKLFMFTILLILTIWKTNPLISLLLYGKPTIIWNTYMYIYNKYYTITDWHKGHLLNTQ